MYLSFCTLWNNFPSIMTHVTKFSIFINILIFSMQRLGIYCFELTNNIFWYFFQNYCTFVLPDRCFNPMFIFYSCLITCLYANFYSFTITAIAWYGNRAHLKNVCHIHCIQNCIGLICMWYTCCSYVLHSLAH